MKLNNLSRLTALLMAILMLAMTSAVAEDSGMDISGVTGDYLTTIAERAEAAATMVEDGYCSVCANNLANYNITVWPVSEHKCLHTYFSAITASQAYDVLVMLANGTEAQQDLYFAYINAHNDHYYSDKENNNINYPAVMCSDEVCTKFVQRAPVQPGAANHDETCPWYDEEYVQISNGLNAIYGSDGVTIEGYILALEDANGVLTVVATTDKLDETYFYFKDVTTGWYVAYLHEVTNEDGTMTQWIIPLPSEKDLEENPAN